MDPNFLKAIGNYSQFTSDEYSEDDDAYDCSMCEKSYLSKSALNRHLREVHFGYFTNTDLILNTY
jgi:hypothetical protein